MAHLIGLTQLTRLDVRRTRVSGAGLVHLRAMKRLQWLNLEGTGVTEAELRELRNALPSLKKVLR